MDRSDVIAAPLFQIEEAYLAGEISLREFSEMYEPTLEAVCAIGRAFGAFGDGMAEEKAFRKAWLSNLCRCALLENGEIESGKKTAGELMAQRDKLLVKRPHEPSVGFDFASVECADLPMPGEEARAVALCILNGHHQLRGMSERKIAGRAGISHSALRRHLRSVRASLGMASRPDPARARRGKTARKRSTRR